MDEIRTYLRAIATLKGISGEPKPNGWEDMIAAKGTGWTATAPLPEGIEPGEKGTCFENAFKLAERMGWTYVEGWAVSVIPLHHAWVVDDDGNVVDPTWDFEEGRVYYGLPISLDYVRRVTCESETWGVFYKPEALDLMTEETA